MYVSRYVYVYMSVFQCPKVHWGHDSNTDDVGIMVDVPLSLSFDTSCDIVLVPEDLECYEGNITR